MNTSHRALLLFLSRMRKQKPKGLHPKVHWNNSYNIYFASKSCFYSGLIQNHWSQQPKAERSNILQSLTAQREHHTSVGYRPFSPRSGPCRHTADLAYRHPTKLGDMRTSGHRISYSFAQEVLQHVVPARCFCLQFELCGCEHHQCAQ